MMWLVLLGFLFLVCVSVVFRVLVTHPISTIRYAVTDFIKYIRYKQWRLCKTGEIIAYTGLFGRGKTLSAVHRVCSIFNNCNNKWIYDKFRKKWVVQKVHIISNVALSIPYEKFESLMQVVDAGERFKKIDEENNTLTIVIVLGDEFSVQLNSREFKKNIDPLFLNTLLTCRHHHISLIYTAQRFGHVDALLRQVTSYVVECKKVWRVQCQYKYDAYELEYATSPDMVKPIGRGGWFIKDKDFDAYDTLACVGNLAKSCKEGDMLSETEILALQCNTPSDNDNVVNMSRKLKRSKKKVT